MWSLLKSFELVLPDSVYSINLFNFLFLFLNYVLCLFLSTMAVLEPFPQTKKKTKTKKTCLVFRRLFYIYVSYFYIFFYGYLLHIVVYITVV